MRRSRAHKAGDHSLCRTGCAALKLAAPLPDVTPAQDPRAELQALAGLLAQAYKADPGNASLARELRMTLQALMGGKPGDGELAAFLAGFSNA
jgi:hypothetical protein